MQNCVFCKIAAGELPAYKIAENTDFIAFLDINPNTEGVTLVATKNHFSSDLNSLDSKTLTGVMEFAANTAELLKDKLDVQRVGLVVEGMGVNHFHIKLYPFHGLSNEFKTAEAPERVFHNDYQGYLSTQMGPPANPENLKKIQDKIIN